MDGGDPNGEFGNDLINLLFPGEYEVSDYFGDGGGDDTPGYRSLDSADELRKEVLFPRYYSGGRVTEWWLGLHHWNGVEFIKERFLVCIGDWRSADAYWYNYRTGEPANVRIDILDEE